ncbi:MAG: hypothetical protein IKZ96_02370 [Bacilli bacterium]|nr:hypothetical protein [Bacilli bacterium]
MKRRTKIIIIALVVIVIAIAVCGIILKYFGGKNHKNNIILSTTAGIPYEWNCTINDKDIATIEHVYSKNMQPKVDGGEVQIRYLIKGLKTGNTRCICSYNKTVEPTETIDTQVYEIIVDKKLNVEIINY